MISSIKNIALWSGHRKTKWSIHNMEELYIWNIVYHTSSEISTVKLIMLSYFIQYLAWSYKQGSHKLESLSSRSSWLNRQGTTGKGYSQVKYNLKILGKEQKTAAIYSSKGDIGTDKNR